VEKTVSAERTLSQASDIQRRWETGEREDLHWGDTVQAKVRDLGPLVLGIDPTPRHSPAFLSAEADRFLERHTALLLDCALGKIGVVKFQSAFFEAFGCPGTNALARGIALAKELGFAVILDAKRGDVASTAQAYAQAYLTPASHGGCDFEVDCLTVNPLLGPDSIEPFIDCSRRYGKGVIILSRPPTQDRAGSKTSGLEGHRHLKKLPQWSTDGRSKHLARAAQGQSAHSLGQLIPTRRDGWEISSQDPSFWHPVLAFKEATAERWATWQRRPVPSWCRHRVGLQQLMTRVSGRTNIVRLYVSALMRTEVI
jgi:hypothetical protein